MLYLPFILWVEYDYCVGDELHLFPNLVMHICPIQQFQHVIG